MASTTQRGKPRRQYLDLLASTMLLLALMIGGIVVLARTDSTWSLIAAVAVLMVATAALGLDVRRMLATGESPSGGPTRRPVVALGLVAAATLAVAVVGLRDDTSHAVEGPNAAGAAQTMRDFLGATGLEDSRYAACQYLTLGEQQRVAATAGPGATCPDAFTGTPAALSNVTTVGRVRALHMRTRVHSGQTAITVTGRGIRPLRFALRRATPAEAQAFEAPPSAWRIASGVAALLRSS